jgi:hypothetical protein
MVLQLRDWDWGGGLKPPLIVPGGLLLGLFFKPEDGGDMFLEKVS